MNMRTYNRNSGFSLTEVLIAAGILTIGFMLLLTLFPLGLKLTAKHTEDTISMTAQDEVYLSAAELLRTTPYSFNMASYYNDFRELYWDDKDTDEIIDDNIADFLADTGDFELEYDPFIFLYPSVSQLSSDEIKYNNAMLVHLLGNGYAELIVFTCRRIGPESRFPATITADLNPMLNPQNLSDRPNLLSLDTDGSFTYDTVPGSWIKISDDHSDVLDAVGISPFISIEADIVVNRSHRFDMYGIKVVDIMAPAEDGNYYVVADRNFSKPTRRSFGKIWFVPPAVGAGRSAAVDVTRRTIRID
jgi:hypothetical protein